MQKESKIYLSDGTNVKWFKIFHLYQGFFRKQTTINFFCKGSAKKVIPPRIEYKGFKLKFYKKGDVLRILIVRDNKNILKLDGTKIRFYKNAGLLIKSKSLVKSKYVYGPIYANFKRRKVKLLFTTYL